MWVNRASYDRNIAAFHLHATKVSFPENLRTQCFALDARAKNSAMKHITPALLSSGFPHFGSDGFLISYPTLVHAFARHAPIDAESLLFAAHAAYGWMPTTLNWTSNKWESEASLVESIRGGQRLTVGDMTKIAALINRSITGASKVLHFIVPERFPILDAHIFTYLNALKYREQPMDCGFYITYSAAIAKATTMSGFAAIQKNVEKHLRYEVTSIRAAELLLYYLSLANKKPRRYE